MLLAREKATALAGIERLVAMQAQVARPPFIGLWTRLQDFERGDLLKLFQSRKAVRGTSLRATIHVMSARDFVSFRGAIQPGITRSLVGREKDIDLDSLEKLGRGFFGKGPATFDALRKHLEKSLPKDDVRPTAYGIRVFVPTVQVPTDDPWAFPAIAEFALADKWVGRKIPMGLKPPDALILRYLAAFGPATPADFQVWSYTQGTKEAFERLRPKLVTFRDERKRELFDLPDAPRPDEDTRAPIRFLPDFDNLVLGHDDRTRIIADAHRPRVLTKNLLVRATFLVDGFAAGTWRAERKKSQATLVLEPFGKIAKPDFKALEEEGEALLRFIEPDASDYAIRSES